MIGLEVSEGQHVVSSMGMGFCFVFVWVFSVHIISMVSNNKPQRKLPCSNFMIQPDKRMAGDHLKGRRNFKYQVKKPQEKLIGWF